MFEHLTKEGSVLAGGSPRSWWILAELSGELSGELSRTSWNLAAVLEDLSGTSQYLATVSGELSGT